MEKTNYNKHPMARDARFLRKEYRRALFPVMGSVLGGTINTLIDAVFVTRRLDADALAAVSLNMPLFLVLCMLGCLFASGSFVAASIALGEHDNKKASSYYNSAVLISLIIGFILMILGVLFSGNIADILCGDKKLYSMVESYCRVTLAGAIPYIIVYFPSFFLQLAGQGKSMVKMIGIMISTDVVFDVVCLYVFNLGVAGAALASLLSISISCVYGFSKLEESGSIFAIEPETLKIYGLKEIFRYGSVQALGSLMSSMRILGLNWIIYLSGGAPALAIWAVINSLHELTLCFISGVPRTADPLVGLYSGNHDNQGIRMIIQYEAILGLVLSLAFSLIVLISNRWIQGFFKLDTSVVIPLVCMCLGLFFEMLCSILGAYYNVTKRIVLSNLIMFLRTVAFALPVSLVLFLTQSIIWAFMPISLALVFVTVLLITRIISLKSKSTDHELSGLLLLDDYLEKNNKIKSISIEASDEKICEASEYIIDFCNENGMDNKISMKLGLALEEVMMVMATKALKSREDPVDVRVYFYDNKIGISIMCSGKKYNLFEDDSEDVDFMMGVNMIQKVAKKCLYSYTLGINVLSVEV